MSMTLTLSQGATTITLSGDGSTILGCRFVPTAPDPQVVAYESALSDGSDVFSVTRRSVTESITVVLEGTAAEIRAQSQEIEMMLLAAERRQRQGFGDRVYLTYQAASGEDDYRSEVLAGALLWSQDRDRRQFGASSNSVEVEIVLTRQFFWEGDETEIELSNALVPAATGGQDIVNTPDSVGVANWVGIASTQIEGVLDTPLKLAITNDESGNRTSEIWAALTPDRSSNALALLYVDATGSGTWATSTWTTLWTWDLSTAILATLLGEWFQSLTKFTGAPGSAYQVRWLIQLSLTDIWTSQPVKLDTSNYLQPTGVVQLPPYLAGESSLYPLKISLQAKYSGGGSLTPDYVQFFLADNMRSYTPAGYGLAQDVTLTDDPGSGNVYTDGWTSAGKTGHYVATGRPMMLQPGQGHMIHVLHRETTGAASASRGSILQAWYRPRRLTI